MSATVKEPGLFAEERIAKENVEINNGFLRGLRSKRERVEDEAWNRHEDLECDEWCEWCREEREAMPRPVCVKCECELRAKTNGTLVIETMGIDNLVPYKVWHADLYRCPNCGIEIVTQFAQKPIMEHFEDNFVERLDRAIKVSPRVVYDNEIPSHGMTGPELLNHALKAVYDAMDRQVSCAACHKPFWRRKEETEWPALNDLCEECIEKVREEYSVENK